MRRRAHAIALLAATALLCGLVAGIPVHAAGSPAPVDRQVLRATGRTSALIHAEQGALGQALHAAGAAGVETGTVYEPIEVFVAYGTGAELARLAGVEAVRYVEANRRIRLLTGTSHTATRGRDVLDGAATLPGGTAIDGSGVGVAVVDSGIDGTHPDLAPRMGGNVMVACSAPLLYTNEAAGGFAECRGPKEYVELEDTGHPSASGHGTHVGGIVAGTGGASNGDYHGAAPGATLYGIGTGTGIFMENGLDGLAWVLENHDQVTPPIKVVNMSWGSVYATYQPGDPMYAATWKLQEELVEAGITVVVAAGNSGGNGTTATTNAECINPTPGIVCVANYDDKESGTRSGTIDSGSSRGSTTDVASWPDVSAPGYLITSACRITLPDCNLGGGMTTDPPNLYSAQIGTSMAAPHVAGIAAQLYQADPTLTPGEVENVLEDTAHKFAFGTAYGLLTDPTNPDDTSSFEKGHGLVDALAAVQTVLNGGVAPTPTPTPTPSPSPTPTPTPGDEGTRYYFHANIGSDLVVGNTDAFVVDGRVFDTDAPAEDRPTEWVDLPGPNAGYYAVNDPNWVGYVDGPIESITFDFWARTPVGQALGDVSYTPVIWVAGTAHTLPPMTLEVAPAGGPIRLVHTYTTMLDAAGQEVPLSVDPGGLPVTISIAGTDPALDAGSTIVYDHADYPSGFVVGDG